MAFNTRHPVGSTDPRDLYDNATNFDRLINGSDPFYADRLGRQRLSWSGMEEDFNNAQAGRATAFEDFLQRSGFVIVGDYGPNITLTSRSQLIVRDGYLYRLSYATTIPYTTTGNWDLEKGNFVLQNQEDALRQDLTNNTDLTKGASLIAGVARVVPNIAALRKLPSISSRSALVLGYNTIGDGGSGDFYLDPADKTSADNAITVIVAADGGRWKLEHDGHVDLYQAGCVDDGVTDNTAKIQALVNLAIATDAFEIIIPKVGPGKSFRMTAPITINGGLKISGEGCEPHTSVSGSGQNARGSGSWFYLDHTGKGFSISAGASSDNNSASTGVQFNGVGTIRKHTLVAGATTAFTPTESDYDFDVNNADVSLENVTTLNPYKAVRLVNGSYGRVTIRGLRGQPLSQGVVIEESYDTCRILDVQFWPFWSHDQRVWNYTLANLRSFVSVRNDNPFYQNIFSIFHNVGFNILGSDKGTTNKAKVFGADIDRGMYGVVQDSTSNGASALFVGFSAQGESGVTGNNSGILLGGTGGEFTFEAPDLRLYNGNCLRVYGTNNSVIVSNPKMASFNKSSLGYPAVEVGANNRVDIVGRVRIGDTNNGAFYGGAGTIRAPGESGSTSATTNGAGQVVVTHGAGYVPGKVFVAVTGGGNGATAQVTAKTSTTFTVNFYNGTAALVNTAVAFDWEVKL
ncbi:hypothetical protein [Pseudomonas sp.]|uniref:hypothetical protein n=1 Tax=Pseudomonas sp. TaxID=306 RepID=UPI00289832AF|nr:hypothetical protein [Pseudomonas sp.]